MSFPAWLPMGLPPRLLNAAMPPFLLQRRIIISTYQSLMQYSFIVQARNAAGWGAASTAVNYRAPNVSAVARRGSGVRGERRRGGGACRGNAGRSWRWPLAATRAPSSRRMGHALRRVRSVPTGRLAASPHPCSTAKRSGPGPRLARVPRCAAAPHHAAAQHSARHCPRACAHPQPCLPSALQCVESAQYGCKGAGSCCDGKCQLNLPKDPAGICREVRPPRRCCRSCRWRRWLCPRCESAALAWLGSRPRLPAQRPSPLCRLPPAVHLNHQARLH